jgi:hypothetical protein
MSIERMRERLAADRESFIEPCLPSPADKPPSGSNWIHEIKHDGFPSFSIPALEELSFAPTSRASAQSVSGARCAATLRRTRRAETRF